MSTDQNEKYSTESEQSFVSGLGGWSPHVKSDRLTLLRSYQRAIAKRTNWGAINRVEIERHVVACVERAAIVG